MWSQVARMPQVHWDIENVLIAKALGGCGIHNAMLYVRALPSDVERWGLKNWTWNTVLDTYIAAENFTAGPASEHHGSSGPIQTAQPYHVDDLSRRFLDACTEMGIPSTKDFNAPTGRYGSGIYHFNIRDGVRDGAARAYLGPVMKTRSNLHVLLGTEVKRLVLDRNRVVGMVTKSTAGAEVTHSFQIHSKVVVTAGAIQSPKLLMVSGIGPEDVLSRHGIPVQLHAPGVGQNLQDHPAVAVAYELLDEKEQFDFR